MNSQKLSLYIVGGLGVAFSIYGIFNGTDISTIIMGLVCGSSLILGARYSDETKSETPCE